ncbi:unnamed protein product [marine sediment metagenome]|uniref:Uncharacterized protein n=1 Tax=marine sediment metagenome TaxID=412755 RepID=X0VAB6_9ZZZZ
MAVPTLAILFTKTEEEVLAWDDLQFADHVNKARQFGRWLWNFFPPQAGGKDEAEIKASADMIREATPELLLPSEEKFEDIRAESEFHGIVGPQG